MFLQLNYVDDITILSNNVLFITSGLIFETTRQNKTQVNVKNHLRIHISIYRYHLPLVYLGRVASDKPEMAHFHAAEKHYYPYDLFTDQFDCVKLVSV